VPASFLTGLVGCFLDRPRWLAIAMTVLTLLILSLFFAPALADFLC
jgi:hypothetical protein